MYSTTSRPTVVFDLDGTLANIEHRVHLANEKKWDEFFLACDEDAPEQEIIALCNIFYRQLYTVEIWSGRSDIAFEKTMKWLHKHNVNYHSIRMRPHGNYMPDVELKEHWLLNYRNRIFLVFDDRKAVVDMWRSHGIKCLQVEPGEF